MGYAQSNTKDFQHSRQVNSTCELQKLTSRTAQLALSVS